MIVGSVAWVAWEGAWIWSTEAVYIGVICGIVSHAITGKNRFYCLLVENAMTCIHGQYSVRVIIRHEVDFKF